MKAKIHPNYYPTLGIRPGAAVTFKVRTFNTTAGHEVWDFGDGSPPSTSPNPAHLYSTTGTYQVTLAVQNQFGKDTYTLPVVVLIPTFMPEATKN